MQASAPAQKRTAGALVVCALGAAALYLGVLGMAAVSFGWTFDIGAYLCVLAGVLAVGVSVWFVRANGWRQLVPATVLLAAVLWCALLWKYVQPSAATLYNQALRFYEVADCRIYLPIGGGEAAAWYALLPLCVMLGTAGGMLAALIPAAGGAVAMLCAILLAAGRLTWSAWVLAVLAAGVFLTQCRSLPQKSEAAQAAGVHAVQTLLLSAVLLSVAVPTGLWQQWDVSGAQESVHRAVHHARYERTAQTMPEGCFDGAAALTFDDTPMLEVIMTDPQQMYLRSYVGQNYSESGWKAADGEALLDQTARFYWLHKSGFYPESQLHMLAEQLKLETTDTQVSVRMLGACRENIAAPYGLRADGAPLDAAQLRDTLMRGSGLTGAARSEYTADGLLDARCYELLDLLDQNLDKDAMQDYLALESEYRAYVYETYLTMPEQTHQTISTFLGQAPETITSFEAKACIRACLADAAEYAQAPGQTPEGEDFVSFFLKQSGAGNAVHYASAAVMMMRYYGIPARYVEGYLITPAAAESVSAGQTLTLRSSDAHAWCEYYEDGVGWIPFETTPPYLGVMAESDWRWFTQSDDYDLESAQTQNGSGGVRSQTRRPDAVTQQTQTEREREQLELEASSSQHHAARRAKSLWWLLWLTLALLLLLLVLIVFRRREILKKRRAQFESDDCANAVAAMFAHAMKMMWASGMARRNVPVTALTQDAAQWGCGGNFDVLAALNEEALFSGHAMTPEQRGVLAEFSQQTLECFQTKLKPWQKLYQKWIRCMY